LEQKPKLDIDLVFRSMVYLEGLFIWS